MTNIKQFKWEIIANSLIYVKQSQWKKNKYGVQHQTATTELQAHIIFASKIKNIKSNPNTKHL